MKSLPPFPVVALKLLGVLDDEEVPLEQVVELLRIDPALSADLLRVSNSALYGLRRQVDSVSQAIVVLGTVAVKRLALTVALGRFSQSFLHHQGLRKCWDHSVAGALIAEQLAASLHEPKDRGYTAGLLHDVGRLALLACHPVQYATLFEEARGNHFDELECERELFGIDHCAAGEWLAQSWGLPADLVDAIAHHHEAEATDTSLLSIVTAANTIADALGFGVFQAPPTASVAAILSQLPINDHEQLTEELEGLSGQINSTIDAVTPLKRV